MKAFIGITDLDWFNYLSNLPEIDEVNFWQPSGKQLFDKLSLREPFLFKLHYPDNVIVGGGLFAHSSLLPLSLAWEAFTEKNGAKSFQEMRTSIIKYRGISPATNVDFQIGCILLEQPFFFSREEWIKAPKDWSPNIVQGKTYDLSVGIGKELWDEVDLRLKGRKIQEFKASEVTGLYGKPQTILPRLGQGSFRIMVTDLYQRRCAVTQERTLPALEAAHIKPYIESGPHSVNNGILFRSDIHKLFDRGYVTISSDYHFEVSKKIKEEYENGRDYYAMQGKPLSLPGKTDLQPSSQFINWHNEKVFLG